MSLAEILNSNSIARDMIAAVLGLCVGSFLNVLAIRSLQEKSLISPPSHCPHCQHELDALDLIPFMSWIMLTGKCRYCKGSIHWHYPLVELFTAITFVVLLHRFGPDFHLTAGMPIEFETYMQWGILLGMLFFACTLIAVTITDFKERLIPHEITYPSMLIGIIFSATVNADQVGIHSALMGIGVSYILFDFIAFYGLKLYIAMHGDPDDVLKEEKKKILTDRDQEGLMIFEEEVDPQIDHVFEVKDKEDEEEEFEVMGGGDAVLSAVISAWLGIQALSMALLVGFCAGTVMGAGYLLHSMYKRQALKTCLVPSLIGATVVVALVEGLLLFIRHLSTLPGTTVAGELPFLPLGLAGAFCGALLGVLKVGREYSKPFPFGPALAFGAAVAMFYKPF